jgi:hypothetical protein
MVDRLIKFVSCAELIESQRCTYRLNAPTQTQFGVGLPNGSEHSYRLRQQTATGEVVDIHDGGGAKSAGHKQAATCNLHSLEHLKGEMQTCV